MTAPRFTTEADAVTYIFRSLRKLRDVPRGPDELTRDTSPTTRLIHDAQLLSTPREYAVVTGSKGKGSTTLMTAKILQQLGHTVGMISSPHLVTYRERIRVNGRAIPEADFTRILSDLAPFIDAIEEGLGAQQYFSPQGIFLATALRWFDEQDVNAAVLEVGRGGRFDDIAVVPNRLSLFTPIMLEHPRQLGPTIERIAWHKAGIIKPHGYAYSVPQATAVLDILQAEADARDAEFAWIMPSDMGQYAGATPNGLRMTLGRYGDLELPMLGRYQIDNATLAVQGAGNVHGRLPGISHGAPEYVTAVKAGLAASVWPGRVQKLQSAPDVYVDGAIHADSARAFVRSLDGRLHEPVIAIVGVPDDKDYAGVFAALGPISRTLIVTETARNISLHFLPPEDALAAARLHNPDVRFAPDLNAALDEALPLAGSSGTVLIAGTLSLVADAIGRYGLSYEQI
jgi:dihydrofolate synthase/folylpolyglutamate synthase